MLRAFEVAEPDIGNAARAREQDASVPHLAPDPVADRAVAEPLSRRTGAAGLDPHRERDEQPGRGPFVGICVEGDIEALAAGFIYQGEHLVGRAGEGRPVIEVGDVRRRARSPPNIDRLAKRVEEPIAQRVPNVRVVEAAQRAGHVGEIRQLRRRGV